MRDFEYIEPFSLEDALDKLFSLGSRAKVLAGGTDLLVKMKRGVISPEYVINLKSVPGLEGISLREDGTAVIGSLTKLSDIIDSTLLAKGWPVVPAAAREMASVQVRNLATIGGNLCNAAPSADMAPPLIVLGARAVIASKSGERSVLLEDFFTGPGATVLAPNEILLRVEIPPFEGVAAYIKHGIRKAMDIAIVGVAASVLKGQDGRLVDVKIALGAVAPVPIRARRAEQVIMAKGISQESLKEAGDVAAEECKPITDVRGSEWYRREMVRVLVRRALGKCLTA